MILGIVIFFAGLFVASLSWTLLFYPMEMIMTYTQPYWNATEAGREAMGTLHTEWLWAPIVCFVLLCVSLFLYFQERQTVGGVYAPY